MTIQLNTDNSVTVHEGFSDKLKTVLENKLKRFDDHITRLEVHLSDDNGLKFGENDKKCLLEARIEGRQPVAVTAGAGNYEKAVDAAIDKLKSSLDTIFGRLSNH